MSPALRDRFRTSAVLLAAFLLIATFPLGVLGAGLVTTVDDDATLIEDPTPDPWSIDVLANDTYPDGATIVTVTQGSIGSVTIAGDGLSVFYAPNADANGSDSFTYTLDDGTDSDTGTVNVTVEPQNDAPSGADKTVSTNIDTPRAFATSDFGFSDVHDSPPHTLLSVRITTLPDAGQLTDNGIAVGAGDFVSAGAINGGDLVFTPAAAATGSPYTSFTFQVRDNGGTVGVNLDPTPRTMTINVVGTPANRQPNARNDVNLTVPESAGSTALDVLGNDTDPDGDTLLITATTNGDHGKVAITGGGTGLTYNPKQLYVGNDVFTYTVSDGRGGTDTASVLVTVARDTTKPITIAPLERYTKGTVTGTSAKVRLSWSATDSGTGVASYKLQVSTNGGSYRTISLPNATSTTITRSLTDKATYRFRVRATDKEGNRSTYAYGPTLKAWRFQDSSAAVHLGGHWTTKRVAGALGSHSFTCLE